MKSRGIAVILLLCMFLGACGNSQQTEENTDIPSTGESASPSVTSATDKAEKIVRKDMPDVDEALQEYLPENGSYKEIFWDMAGDTIYRFVRLLAKEGWTEGYCLQKLGNPYEKWECQAVGLTDWIEGAQCYVEEASLTREGNLQLLLSDTERENFYWAEWTEEGPCTVPPTKIEGPLLNADFLSSNGKMWYINSDRCSYLYLNSEFQFYDADFTSKTYGSEDMRGMFYQVAQTDDGTYVYGNDMSYQFTIWDAETGKTVFSSKEAGAMESEGRVIFASSEEVYLCNRSSLVRFSLKDGSSEIMLGFENEGYLLSHVYAGTIREDGTVILLAKSNGETILLEMPENTTTDLRQELEFAMSYTPSPFLQELVVDFNRQNTEYNVILRFPETDEDWNDFRNRITAEMGSGGGPDIIDGKLLDIGEAVQKGYLKDMTDACAQDKDRIWEAAWATGEVNGKNYMIPYSCRLWTLVSSEELVGQQETWNLTQLEQCLNDSGCSAALGGINTGELGAEAVFYYLGIFSKSDCGLIDWENGTSHLNDQKAVQLMEFVKQHMDTGKMEEQGERIAEGEIPVVLTDIRDINTLQLVAALFHDEERYIGFPVEQGEKGSFLSCDGVMVNQASQKEEGINEFLSYLLSQKTQQKIAAKACEGMSGIGLAVDKEALELFCEYALEGKYVDDYVSLVNTYNGYEYESMVLTRESVEKFRNAFESAGPMPDTGMIYSIIAEETPAYFSGSRTAEEVCDVIQNRVQLYLNEMR